MTPLPKLLDYKGIQERLELIFLDGITNRNYVIREMAARTIFVMLYVDAIEGNDIWIRPDQVTKMTDEQALITDKAQRYEWCSQSTKPSKKAIPGRWYAQNTREPIRDETLRQGLVENGAVIERKNLPTTSPKGRYALESEFAELFDPLLNGDDLAFEIENWQKKYLSASAMARLKLMKRATSASKNENILTTFPNGETRRLAPGPSSVISKAVIEEFAPMFLNQPAVLWLSESASKEDQRDTELANSLGINIEADKFLPDIILVDIGTEEPLFVFIEVVASDGPVTEKRREALLKLITDAGFSESQATFVTAYADREQQPFRKTFPTLAWQSFAWNISEPDKIIGLHIYKSGMKIQDLIIPKPWN